MTEYVYDPDNGAVGGIDYTDDYGTALKIGLVYPAGGWNKDVEVLSVASGEVKEVAIDLGASVTSVMQPVPTKSIGPYKVPGISCYTIVGNDDLPIDPKEWKARGGRIHVTVNEDTRSAILTITGPDLINLSPFTIAESSGDSTYYSTLRLVGTGVAFRAETIHIETGVSDDKATQDVVTIDNEFLQDEATARNAAMHAIGKAIGGYQTIVITAATAEGLPDGQQWGNAAGARILWNGSWYRVRSATHGSAGITMTAEMDMTEADFDTAYAGWTQAQWEAANDGYYACDFDAQPVPEGALGDG